MYIILDESTLTKEEIAYINENANAEYWQILNIDSVASDLEVKTEYLCRNSFFITKGNKKYTSKNPSGNSCPIFTIKISNTKVWSLEELDIDAKIEKIEHFFQKKFLVLFGEEMSYNNFHNGLFDSNRNNKLTRTYIVQKKEYSIDSNFRSNMYLAEILGYSQEDKETFPKIYESYVVSLGRYYPTTQYYRNTDIYSSKIIKGKKADLASQIFYKDLVNMFTDEIKPDIVFDQIFYVPCKPGRKDRFIEINSDNVLSVDDYGDISNLSEQDKINKMLGHFSVVDESKVRGKNILLVDDILTTGSTMTVISDLLFSYGAKSIVWLTFAKTHHVKNDYFFNCKKCEKPLSFRFNGKDGNWFLGCSGYPNCKETYNYKFNDLEYVFKG